MLGLAQHKEWNEGDDIGCVHGVDVSRTESTHTVVMVERRVDAVDTYSVHSKLLQEWNVARAGGVRQQGSHEELERARAGRA